MQTTTKGLYMKALIINLLLIPVSLAGTINVNGVSNIGKTPDYIELKVNSVAKCFNTAKESNDAAQSLSIKLQDLIKRHIDISSGDQLVVTTGRSSRKDETTSIFDNSSNRNRTVTLCKKGWRSSRSIIAKFSDLEAFESLNPELLDLIDKVELDQRANNNGIITATVDEPIARLMPETTDAMEEQALKEALINASDKFQTIKNLCDLQNASISGISEGRAVVRPYRDDTGSGGDSDSLNFALQYVHLSYNITFSFDNTSGTCADQTSIL
jgi:hypothetical protein